MRRTDPCASFYSKTVKHRQSQTSFNRYVEGKTQEYSESMRGSSIDEQYLKGFDKRGNPSTRAIVQAGANRVQTARRRVNPGNTGKNQNTRKQARQDDDN